MFHVDIYFRVRKRACLVEGMSVREASRVFDVHRDTVRKMLANATIRATRGSGRLQAEAGALHRRNSRHTGGGQPGAQEAAAHGEAHL